jgi:hypothetical protein
MATGSDTLPPVAGAPSAPKEIDMNDLLQFTQMNGVNAAVDALVSGGMAPVEAMRMLEGAGVQVDDLARPEDVTPAAVASTATASTSTPVRRAEASTQPTGVAMELGFFDQLNSAQSQEEFNAMYDALPAVQQHVYDRSFGQKITPAWAAQKADEFFKMQDERAKTVDDPAKRADAAARQAEIQEAYRQEVEYQRSLATINDSTKSSAERNAARMQIEALSAGIGKRINPKLGTSAAAMNEAKNAVGYIGAYEYKNPLADFGSRISTMQRNSQERMGLVRQQMEAAGMPVPEMAVPEAPPSPEQIASQMAQAAIQKRGLKGPDGNLLTVAAGEGQSPQPIVARMRGGKKEYRRVGPDGLFYPLTPDQIKALGLK